MERVRNVRLDHVCEAIGEQRAIINQAKQEEAGLEASALGLMQGSNISVYKHAGVELARVPGTEKIRVRLTKETGDAEVSGGVTVADNAGEELEGLAPDAGEPFESTTDPVF